MAGQYSEMSVDGRTVSVWVPDQVAPGCPLLLAHDGQNLFTPQHSISGASWRLDEAIEALHVETGAPRPVVVGPWNAGESRWAEYAPESVLLSGVLGATPEQLRGTRLIGDAYARWCATRLVPWAQEQFGAGVDRAATAVMGSSMGGLASVYALSLYPDTYGAALCLSTHWSMGGEGFVRSTIGLLPLPGRHRLWFDHGTEGVDAQYGPLQDLADATLVEAGWSMGRDVQSGAYEGADHNEYAWAGRVRDPLAFWLTPIREW
ncbi:MAG: alpha/beta hydrolase-fold protein [Chloroflexota bacterium]